MEEFAEDIRLQALAVAGHRGCTGGATHRRASTEEKDAHDYYEKSIAHLVGRRRH